jgi:RNA polymerase sigma-70 factor, ECF subfamily
MNDGDPDRQFDSDLLARIAAGDEAAFGILYDRFAPGLYSLVLKMTGDSVEAQDVLQDAFAQIWRKAETFDRRRSAPFTWAVMVTRNRCIDRLRLRARYARLAERAAAEPAPQSDDRSVEEAGLREERARVRAALAEVSTEQREAIELAFFNDLTHEQIAERLGAPLGTIKARIRRGLLKLRELLSAAP